MSKLSVRKIEKIFTPDHSRVLPKLYLPSSVKRIRHVIFRVIALTDEEVTKRLDDVITSFTDRHKNIWNILDKHYFAVSEYIPPNIQLSEEKRALLGAYFTMEYSVQAAAFFNPSIVEHPDQSHIPKGGLRFIMSFRSVGEGHISSIEFRKGVVDGKGEFTFEPVSPYVERPIAEKNPLYDKATYEFKLNEMHAHRDRYAPVLDKLPDHFRLSELQAVLKLIFKEDSDTADTMLWLAESNYEVQFSLDQKLSERIIYPYSQQESNGIEDARFVRFVDEDGDVTYYATYTAYNGFKILPQILMTKDFLNFKIITLNGEYANDKGMALFPRKIDGQFMVISRNDGENLFLMRSDNIFFWQEAIPLKEPEFTWEFIQIGNCGSPIELPEGWLVLTHGVGAMRQYCIGAILLDLADPSIVIGQTKEPILVPTQEEREGYVPNVVYSCGAIAHNGSLIIPYAMSDTKSGVAVIQVADLLKKIE